MLSSRGSMLRLVCRLLPRDDCMVFIQIEVRIPDFASHPDVLRFGCVFSTSFVRNVPVRNPVFAAGRAFVFQADFNACADFARHRHWLLHLDRPLYFFLSFSLSVKAAPHSSSATLSTQQPTQPIHLLPPAMLRSAPINGPIVHVFRRRLKCNRQRLRIRWRQNKRLIRT